MPASLSSPLPRSLMSLGLVGVLLAALTSDVRADAKAEEGFGLDAQLVGGGGFSFRSRLDNYFLGRLRVGGLYAGQPWTLNFGATVQFGALARFGVGGELELNHSYGPYASVGLAHVSGDEWMAHASIGFMIFGIELQHRFTEHKLSDALMFEVRLPLGIWWQRKREESAATKASDAARLAEVRPFAPVQMQPAAATTPVPPPAGPLSTPSAAGAASVSSPPPPAAAAVLALPPEQEAERAQQLEAAQRAHEHGDHVAEALALARAEALRQEVPSALALAATHVENGKLILAHAQLQRVLATYALTPEERAHTEAELRKVAARLAHLRLIVNGGQERDQVLIDGSAEPAALAGYDVALDPGEHQLQIVRAGRALAQRAFHAADGELVRITVDEASNAQPGL